MELNTLDTKLSTLSEKYTLIKTKDIAAKFKSMGFVVDDYKETKVRKASKQGYQKHMVRLSNPNMLLSTHNDIKLQLLVTNSHDGLNAFKIQLGFFRLVCANGMVVGKIFDSVSIRHSGNVIEQIDTAIQRMINQVTRLDTIIAKMKETRLDTTSTANFLAESIKLRYPDKQLNDVTVPVLRPEDAGNTVFELFNRVQETLVRGGNTTVNSQGKLRSATPIRSLGKLSVINEGLFDLAAQYAA